MKKKNIIVGVTGSVACYKSLDLISMLIKKGAFVTAVLTREAEEFIRPALFQSVTGNKVVIWDLFKAPETWDIAHVSLAEKADIVVIMPATANIIGKISSGICDDALSCTVITTKAPVLFVPAMNEAMYTNKIVQENISRLKKAGYYFSGPVKGRLACGTEGLGHIQDTAKVMQKISALIS